MLTGPVGSAESWRQYSLSGSSLTVTSAIPVYFLILRALSCVWPHQRRSVWSTSADSAFRCILWSLLLLTHTHKLTQVNAAGWKAVLLTTHWLSSWNHSVFLSDIDCSVIIFFPWNRFSFSQSCHPHPLKGVYCMSHLLVCLVPNPSVGLCL